MQGKAHISRKPSIFKKVLAVFVVLLGPEVHDIYILILYGVLRVVGFFFFFFIYLFYNISSSLLGISGGFDIFLFTVWIMHSTISPLGFFNTLYLFI